MYDLNSIKSHTWQTQPCSGKTAEGLLVGLQWLSEQMIQKKENRFPNNPYLSNNKNYNKVDNNTNNTFRSFGNSTLNNNNCNNNGNNNNNTNSIVVDNKSNIDELNKSNNKDNNKDKDKDKDKGIKIKDELNVVDPIEISKK